MKTEQPFEAWSYGRHAREFDGHAAGGAKSDLARTWLKTDTVDYWRHARLYACLDPFLEAFPGASWVTVGDGRYGRDAHYLMSKGARAMATDISDTLLREGKAAGLIDGYRQENAEALSFADETFDFAFCKESLHHMPRPILAIYEMLRVTRRGIVFIEPNDEPVLGNPAFIIKRVLKRLLLAMGLSKRLRTPDTSLLSSCGRTYEESGNYVYGMSPREIEKMALALNFPAVAFKGMNDWYIAGVEQETLSEDSALFRDIRRRIARADRACRRGLSLAAPANLVGCILKMAPDAALTKRLEEDGFRVILLPRNPHLKQG
jgi:ubiquinone/menaquinone biosynthesis C-methylase UbiE